MKGQYDTFGVFTFNYPQAPGNEASGVVVKSGGGIMANDMMGKNVAFTRIVSSTYEYTSGGVF
jgi:NADPH:quinone reductase-like Zn-dependent oxidoreductase